MDAAVTAFFERRSKREPEPAPPPSAMAFQTPMDFIVARKLSEDPESVSDIQRICRLPISSPLTPLELEAISSEHVKPEQYEQGFRLKPVQAEALQSFAERGTLFGSIEVGGGKTLIALRCISLAFEMDLCQRAILLVPPNVYSQLIDHDIGWARKRVQLGVTFHLLGGKSPEARRTLAQARRGCWIMPYSLLSAKDASEILELIKPDLIFADEAHNLKNRKTSARTRRLLAYWKKHRPRFAATSGTITAKSLRDYAHLVMMSLGQGSPLPMDLEKVDEWAAVLDSEQAQEAHHSRSTNSGPLRPLINWSNVNFPSTPLTFDVQGFRRAYQFRLLTTPGVISSPPDSLGTSLVIENRRDGLVPNEELLRLTRQLNDTWTTPDGDELEHAMQVWKWKMELTAGFYSSLKWPSKETLAKRKGISEQHADELISKSIEHHKAKQLYHRELRAWFASRPHKAGLDTPMLVGSDMARHGAKNVGDHLYGVWMNARALDFEERIDRDSTPVRICDYKVQEAVRWAKGREDGIIWFWNQAIGVWITEALKAAGIPVIHCPAGKEANEFLTKPDADIRCKGKFLVCSIEGHGTGKNLQFMVDQLMVQLPHTEQSAQQTIGRTHRTGQKADVVEVTTLICNEADEMGFAAILNDAMYVSETMGSSRKVLVASYNPIPTIYASSMLQRAGIQARLLNARQQQMLGDKFSR